MPFSPSNTNFYDAILSGIASNQDHWASGSISSIESVAQIIYNAIPDTPIHPDTLDAESELLQSIVGGLFSSNHLIPSSAIDYANIAVSVSTFFQDIRTELYSTSGGGSGTQGWQGNQGFQGGASVPGVQGFQGNVGSIGNQGWQGNQGRQGWQGNQGFQGWQGWQGTGSQGWQGNQGRQGWQGNQGLIGVQGDQGWQGNQGSAGNSAGLVLYLDHASAGQTQTTPTVTGTTYAIVAGTPYTITDSSNGFLSDGFNSGMKIIMAGWLNPGNNNIEFNVVNVSAGTLTLAIQDALTAEAAGRSITFTVYRERWTQITPTGSQSDESVTISLSDGDVPVDSYETLVGTPGVTLISAGTWTFHNFCYVDSTANGTVTTIKNKLSVVHSDGTETVLFITPTSSQITSTSATPPQECITSYTLSSPYPISISDRVEVTPLGNNSSDSYPRVLHHLYMGNNYQSYAVTSLNIVVPLGPQGWQGTQGPQGWQGNQGWQGSGVQGPQGNQGWQGNQGNQGWQGNQGDVGSGTQGWQGNQGNIGVQGNQGWQGNQGNVGSGNQGNQGWQGTSASSSWFVNSGRIVSVLYGSTASTWAYESRTVWLTGGVLPTSTNWYGHAYDTAHSRIVVCSTNSTATAYSTDKGNSWTSGGAIHASNTVWYEMVYDSYHSSLVAISTTTSAGVYSTNGGTTWSTSASSIANATYFCGVFDPDHNRVVFVSENTTGSVYTADGGVTWTAGGTIPNTIDALTYDPAHNRIVGLTTAGNIATYSTDGGATWVSGGTLPAGSGTWYGLCYDTLHSRLVAVCSTASAYSTDGGVTWVAGGSFGGGTNLRRMMYDSNSQRVLAACGASGMYSSDDGGLSWNQATTGSASVGRKLTLVPPS
jgi:hypothetical protein